MTPKVSICVTTCDRPNALNRLLKSILSQTYTDYEVIVCDDSGKKNELFHDSHIKYYWNAKPLGQSANMNEAISYARGEYIKPMHDDDWFTNEESLSEYVKLLDESSASFAFSGSLDEKSDGSKIVRYMRRHEAKLLEKNWKQIFMFVAIGAPSVIIWKAEGNWRMDDNFKDIVDLDLYATILSQTTFTYTQRPLVTIGNVLSDHEKKHNTDIFINNMELRRNEGKRILEKYWNEKTDYIRKNYMTRLLESTNASKQEIMAYGIKLSDYNLLRFMNRIYLFFWRVIYFVGRKLHCD